MISISGLHSLIQIYFESFDVFQEICENLYDLLTKESFFRISMKVMEQVYFSKYRPTAPRCCG